jgi:hypothetical protein
MNDWVARLGVEATFTAYGASRLIQGERHVRAARFFRSISTV